MPNIIIKLLYQGNNAKVSVPQSNPLNVLHTIAAVNASVALPCSASGKPSTIVAAAEFAPGIPSSTPLKLSPVVLAATTDITNITPKYGSNAVNQPINPNRATSPVVAPALGTIPTISPYSVPAIMAKNISIFYLLRIGSVTSN